MVDKQVVIKIRGVSKSFKDKKVLDQMDLDVYEGEVLVILGRSGMGKSVLLGLIMGIRELDSGTIEVEGTPITSLSEKERYHHPIFHKMGILFQGGALLDSLSIEENVAFYLKEHGDLITGKPYTSEEIHQKVKEALGSVGLETTENLMSSELSGGMRKRAALARLLAYDPSYLLYDEPTSELDLITSYHIAQLIAKTNKAPHRTSIVVSHDLNLALSIGDRLALLENGKIAHIAPPREFIQINNPTIDSLKKAMLQGYIFTQGQGEKRE